MSEFADTDRITNACAQVLRGSGGNAERDRAAIESFINAAYALGLTSGEITDMFCVSTPSILDMAGLVDPRAAEVVRVFDRVHSEYMKTR